MERPFYLLDTNVLSEIFKPKPNDKLIQMLQQNERFCVISSTSWNELLYGVNIMPEGKKKQLLFERLIDDIQAAYNIIQYDNHAALIQADIRSRLKQKGRPVDFQDTQIASIAVSNCMILVTRNTKHFEPIQEVSPLMMENWFEEN